MIMMIGLVVYYEKVRTTQVFIRDVTPVSVIAALLFGGEISVGYDTRTLTMDGWMTCNSPPRTAVLLKTLRMATNEILTAKISQQRGSDDSERENKLLAIITRIVNEDAAATAAAVKK